MVSRISLGQPGYLPKVHGSHHIIKWPTSSSCDFIAFITISFYGHANKQVPDASQIPHRESEIGVDSENETLTSLPTSNQQ